MEISHECFCCATEHKNQYSISQTPILCLKRCFALVNAGNSGKKKRGTVGQNFAVHICISFFTDTCLRQVMPFFPQSEGPGGPLLSYVLFILTLSWEDKSLPKQEVLTEDVPAWELRNQHCQCSTLPTLKGRPQKADKPSKRSLRDFQQKFTWFLFCFEFCPKNIVISCLLWILSKEHCNHCHSDESAFAGRKKETILLESFSLVHDEVMNLGCFQLVLLLTKVSKTFCPRAKLYIGYFTYTEWKPRVV